MSDRPITDLRRRMIANMTIRSIGDKTQHDYIRHVETFARFLGRSPHTASGDDTRRFQLAQVEQGAQPPTVNTQVSALRFFFAITLGRADLAYQLARTHYPRKLPRVLAQDEVARPRAGPPRAWLGAVYGLAGNDDQAAYELAQACSLAAADRYLNLARLRGAGYHPTAPGNWVDPGKNEIA